MSIIAYVGLPGSGKSYDVVANQILPALKEGRRVVTNIPLNRDHIRKTILGGEIVELPLDAIAQQPEKIDEYATPGCVLVIDELWRLWPSGLRTDKIPQPFKSLLAEHRHKVDSQGRSMQIVFVTQDLSQVAAFARQLVESTFHHTKLSHVGMRGSYRIDVFHGAVTGAVPPVNNRLREVYGKYSPTIFKMYKSHTMSDSSQSGANESAMDARGNALRRPSIWIGLAFVIVAIWFGISRVGAFLGLSDGDAVASAASDAAAVVVTTKDGTRTAAPATTVPGRTSSSPASPYRVVGSIINEEDSTLSFGLVSDGSRTLPIPWSQCSDQRDGEIRCRFRGQLIGQFGVVR